VPTISGMANLHVPPGTQHGTVFKMRDKGVPSVHGEGRGDQHVRVLIEVPKQLNAEQEAKLKVFADSLDRRAHPHLAAFLEKIKRFFNATA
jgi:molecular chaperone DnaJ